MRLIFSILLLLLSTSIYSGSLTNNIPAKRFQSSPLPNPFLVLREHISQNNYLKPLVLLQEREQEYLDSPLKVPFLEAVVLLNSYLNNYEEAYRYEAILLEHFSARNKQREKNTIELSSAPVDSLKMVSAVEIILAKAKENQVIMINEEHRHPLHRAFLQKLLRELHKDGFRYFAAETFTASDTLLNNRGYATQSTGFYTADPVFAGVVREAMKIGFKTIAYEFEGDYPEGSTPDQEQDIREKGQAQNVIDRILSKDPKAKIIVFAGRTHIAETRTPSFSFMAWHFKQLSGIDPFTIDQVQLSERRQQADESPLYKYILNRMDPQQPVSFLYENGRSWSASSNYDLQVLHPRTNYYEGRPTWLYKSGFRIPSKIEPGKLNLSVEENKFIGEKPIVIQVSKEGDVPNAVPVDLIMLTPDQTIPALLLIKGKMKIEAKDEDGNVIGSYSENL